MTSKDKSSLMAEIKNAGGKTSAHDPNTQFLNGVTIKHGEGNKTLFDGKPTYGAASASASVKKIK